MSLFPVWPQSLPQEFLSDGFSNGGDQPVVRQQMESGLDRVTRTSSTTVRNNTYSVVCDLQQLAEFWSFYNGAANGGADFVVMPMFTANGVANHKCRFSSYPTVVEWGIKWRVSFSLETDQQQINWG